MENIKFIIQLLIVQILLLLILTIIIVLFIKIKNSISINNKFKKYTVSFSNNKIKNIFIKLLKRINKSLSS